MTAPGGAVFAPANVSPQGHETATGGRFRRKLGHSGNVCQSNSIGPALDNIVDGVLPAVADHTDRVSDGAAHVMAGTR